MHSMIKLRTNYLIPLQLIMEIKSINTDADYHAALVETESLMTAEPNTAEGEKLNILVTLIEVYERKYFLFDFTRPC